jgi:ubiquinone/menaquinone biosynthesis C-methylase UbiE
MFSSWSTAANYHCFLSGNSPFSVLRIHFARRSANVSIEMWFACRPQTEMIMSVQSVLPAYSMNRPSFPRMYERSLVEPLFRPWAELLLDRAELAPRMGVLDVACGTGIVARLALRRSGGAAKVVGVDVSPPMLEVAREIAPEIDWRAGDAGALPVGPDDRFERVFCQQGLQFFRDRQAAARELRRVTAPGGALLAAVWRAVEEMPVFAELQRVAERHVGPIHDQRYAFGDAEPLANLLSEAGFGDVRVDEASLVSRFADGADFVRMNAMALIGMSGAQLREDEQDHMLDVIAAESMRAMLPFLDAATIVCEMRSNIAVAR